MRGREIVWTSVWRPVAATMAALMLLAGGTRANAQATTATMVGTVTDTTGAALGNATVTITNQSTGQTYVHQTNDSGNYEFTLLPPGVYSMPAEAFARAGKYPLAISVQAGELSDLLATALEVPPATVSADPDKPWSRWPVWGGSGALLVVAAGFIAVRRRNKNAIAKG